MFRVADRRVVDSYRDIGELMKLAVDRIEENFARGDTITGIATGYNDLDELLSGLQPSTLNIVGARPAMGKCVAPVHPMVDVATGEVVTAAELFDSAASAGRPRRARARCRRPTCAVGPCPPVSTTASSRCST